MKYREKHLINHNNIIKTDFRISEAENSPSGWKAGLGGG